MVIEVKIYPGTQVSSYFPWKIMTGKTQVKEIALRIYSIVKIGNRKGIGTHETRGYIQVFGPMSNPIPVMLGIPPGIVLSRSLQTAEKKGYNQVSFQGEGFQAKVKKLSEDYSLRLLIHRADLSLK